MVRSKVETGQRPTKATGHKMRITENKRHLTLTRACTLDSCRDAMMRMARSDVLISGIGGLGVELAKNVILADVRSVTVHDDPSVHR
ncbi:hypothetical protein MTO96_044430 [Rhipicephalus appendiculatus]